MHSRAHFRYVPIQREREDSDPPAYRSHLRGGSHCRDDRETEPPPLPLRLQEELPPCQCNGQPQPGNYVEYEASLKRHPVQGMRQSAHLVEVFRISKGAVDAKLSLVDGVYPEWLLHEDPSFNLVREPPF